MPHKKITLTDAVSVVENIVISCAKRRQSITYSDLTLQSGGLRSPRFWSPVLAKLAVRSQEKYGLNLALLVVSKITGLPSGGFYSCLSLSDAKLWNDNSQAYYNAKSEEIFDYFAKQSSKPHTDLPAELDFLK